MPDLPADGAVLAFGDAGETLLQLMGQVRHDGLETLGLVGQLLFSDIVVGFT